MDCEWMNDGLTEFGDVVVDALFVVHSLDCDTMAWICLLLLMMFILLFLGKAFLLLLLFFLF